jgi:hypothetical protein
LPSIRRGSGGVEEERGPNDDAGGRSVPHDGYLRDNGRAGRRNAAPSRTHPRLNAARKSPLTAAKNGWTALGNKTNSSGQLSQVCPGTTQASGQPGVGTDLKSQQDFYINLQKSFAAGYQHGQAPLLWSAIALLRGDCPGAR